MPFIHQGTLLDHKNIDSVFERNVIGLKIFLLYEFLFPQRNNL